MSRQETGEQGSEGAREQENTGPNLWLIYGLLFLGFLIAIAIAAMIVWPFYIRR